MIKKLLLAGFLAACLAAAPQAWAQQKTVTIAAVNNPQMIELKKLSSKFETENPDIKLNWVIVEENVLRQRVTTDLTTGSGQFDLVFIGIYEAPIFAKRGFLKEMTGLPASFDLDDVFKSLRDGASFEGKLFAMPFYGESCMTMYRKDLFDAKGLTMADQPTYDDIKKAADSLTDKSKGIYGITLRGKPGWGENMAFIDCLAVSMGAVWFDMKWHAQLDSPEWKKAATYYLDIMKKDGPPGASANGFNENLTLFASGKAAIWIDATSGAGTLFDKAQSQVADKVAFAQAPIGVAKNGGNWLWSWDFAIPKAAKNSDAAQKFVSWACSKEYLKMVADDTGWATVPPGTRKSLYDNEDYTKVSPFAKVTLAAMSAADPANPCVKPVPYTGLQYVGIPEFQSIGTVVGQNFAGALAGNTSVDQCLKASQTAADRAVKQAGYQK